MSLKIQETLPQIIVIQWYAFGILDAHINQSSPLWETKAQQQKHPFEEVSKRNHICSTRSQ